MKILFITDYNPSPYCGGIERVVILLSDIFTKRLQCECYLAYLKDSPDGYSDGNFVDKIKISDINLFRNYCLSMKFDVVLNNIMSKRSIKLILPLINNICKENNIKNFFIFHNMPAYELDKICIKIIMKRIFLAINVFDNCILLLKQLVLLLFTPIIKKYYLKFKYLFIVNNVDKVIVLSPYYIDEFINIIGVNSAYRRQFVSIPNPFVKLSVADSNKKLKKNQVLVVSRLEENQKRISLILKIWKKIEQDDAFKNWNLKIVGDGVDRFIYQKIVESNRMRCVSFEGRQNPISYYEESSIFLSTSSSEGFGMTILEALQYSVVPISFDGFSVVKDIINKTNGVLVNNNDVDQYVSQLKNLMKNDSYREELSSHAIETIDKFSENKVALMWNNLFGTSSI